MSPAKQRGQALKDLREKGKVSLKEVADLLPDCSEQEVWRVENGREVPDERYEQMETAIRTIVRERLDDVEKALAAA